MVAAKLLAADVKKSGPVARPLFLALVMARAVKGGRESPAQPVLLPHPKRYTYASKPRGHQKNSTLNTGHKLIALPVFIEEDATVQFCAARCIFAKNNS